MLSRGDARCFIQAAVWLHQVLCVAIFCNFRILCCAVIFSIFGLPTGLDRAWVNRHAVLYFYCVSTGPRFRVLLCVYTPETYRNVRVIRPCFVFCRLLLHCSKVTIAKVLYTWIESWKCICPSVGNHVPSEGCLERTGTRR